MSDEMMTLDFRGGTVAGTSKEKRGQNEFEDRVRL